jgi:TPP-dependent pyruvate/acetoin dehydrogenase alpha subunit
MASTNKRKAADAVTAETHENPLISNAKLKQLYAAMLQCRLLEERLQAIFGKKKAAAGHQSSYGMEAMLATMLVDLLPQDTLSASSADKAAAFLKGLPLRNIFRQMYASRKNRTTGSAFQQLDSAAELNLLSAPSLTVQNSLATGIAVGNRQSKNEGIVLAFAGDASTALEALPEFLRYASRHELPILYITQSPVDTLNAVPFHARAHACGMPGITVDGHDAIALYRVAQEAIGHARSGLGPTLVECITVPGKLNAAHDPLTRMEQHLLKKKLFSAQWKQQIASKFQKELDKAVTAAEKPTAR